jgi:hypothetical protein
VTGSHIALYFAISAKLFVGRRSIEMLCRDDETRITLCLSVTQIKKTGWFPGWIKVLSTSLVVEDMIVDLDANLVDHIWGISSIRDGFLAGRKH